MTRSEIENWDTSYLDTAATTWRVAASQSEDAFAQHRQNIASPGGTTWAGDAKDAALERATGDVVVVGRQGGVLREAADIAETGRHDISMARSEAVAAISAAESDGFSVADDLSVTDTRRVDVFSMRARQNSLNEHAEDIRWYAERLAQTDSFVGERLQAKAAELDGIRFDGEAEGRDNGEGRVRLVDNKIQHDAEEKGEPGEKKPAVPGQAPGQIGPFAVPKSVEDAAKKPEGEVPADSKNSDPTGLGDLLGANDSPEGKPREAEQGKPGDEKHPGLPPALSRLPAAPDKATIDQQRARVEAARQHLAAAEAKANAAFGHGYVHGAGSGPSPDETKSLTQAVFDARRELTVQTDALRDLNAAAATHGGPTVPVPPLPENADKQAFPPPPSISDTLADANHQLSENTFGLIPDVAKDIDTFNNWGQASGEDKAQAILDSAGMLPLPFGKPLAEGLEHGLDIISGARHLDDVPTPHVDTPVAPHTHDDVPSGGHHTPDTPVAPDTDAPSAGHTDLDPGSTGSPGDGPGISHPQPEAIVGPGNESLPVVPPGATGTVADNGKGMVYEIPAGTEGLDSRVARVRVMDPTTTGDYQYPGGYVSYENSAGQAVNPVTGRTISRSDPYWHIPLG
ncbi:hypothetical protein [Mycobacterium sp. NS-7484]|uniref:hypothetical protein n=1 Tax=Mycobacterium sp. NS-7484 TaxID=1834161 RepID=UPI0018EA317B|nr:hypothetical protein [Mycobacterium sp. NS-7484]